MKKLSKIVSIVLSLALCLGMASPAFAASFTELQEAINGKNDESSTEDNPTYYGREEGCSEGGIAAWWTTSTGDDGQDVATRNVKLYEDITYKENENPDKNKTINVGYWGNHVDNVSLDLNGNTIDGTDSNSAVISVSYGNLTLQDTSEKDDEGHTKGTITGGNGGIIVANNSTLTMEGGNITDNHSNVHGGGVSIDKNSTFTMKDGEISNNTAKSNGGGVYMGTAANSRFIMENGTISGNTAGSSGGGVYANGKADSETVTFKMEKGSISNNTASAGGGIYLSKGNATMADGTIYGNKASTGGGVSVATENAVFVMENGSISNNTATSDGGGVRVTRGTFNMEGGAITGNTAKNGGGMYMQSNLGMSGKFHQTGGSISGNTADSGEGMVFAENSEFTVGGLTYTLTYEDGEKVTLEDGTETTMKIVTVSVKDSEGNQINSVVKLIPMLKGNAVFAVDPANPTFTVPAGSTVDGKVSPCGGYLDKDGVFHVVHTPGTAVQENVVDAGCLTAGSYESVTCCSVCGTELSRTPGTIPAAGHTPGEAARENVVDAKIGVEGSYDLVVRCTECDEVIESEHVTTDALPAPIIPDGGMDTDDVTPAPTTVTIADQKVPLAGLVSLAQLLEELRQYEEIPEAELPEDFKWLDHEYAQAIRWGLQVELVADTEEAPFDPDEAVTVALMRKVLTNFVERYLGLEDFTVSLAGEDGEMVMDLGDRLTVFCAELEAYLADQENKAA